MTAVHTTLGDLTTLRVGGPARELVEVTTDSELTDAALGVWADGDDWLALGGGSNLVVSDDGVDGRVIRIRTRGIERVDGEHTLLRVRAGESWDDLVAATVADGLAGLEALSGIPGSVGAAPLQNIGAYGHELAETLAAVDFLDAETGERERLSVTELGLGYRTSVFKRGRAGIVTAVELRLTDAAGRSLPVGYAQLSEALGVAVGESAPVAEVRDAVLALRRSKGMVLDGADTDTWSAGSFFTNPVVREGFEVPAGSPAWPDGAGGVKLSAAWLIERAGIRRGFALPGSAAAISGKHTLAITNTGGATAAQVTELARYVQERVRNEFGVALQPEPVHVGFDRD